MRYACAYDPASGSLVGLTVHSDVNEYCQGWSTRASWREGGDLCDHVPDCP